MSARRPTPLHNGLSESRLGSLEAEIYAKLASGRIDGRQYHHEMHMLHEHAFGPRVAGFMWRGRCLGECTDKTKCHTCSYKG